MTIPTAEQHEAGREAFQKTWKAILIIIGIVFGFPIMFGVMTVAVKAVPTNLQSSVYGLFSLISIAYLVWAVLTLVTMWWSAASSTKVDNTAGSDRNLGNSNTSDTTPSITDTLFRWTLFLAFHVGLSYGMWFVFNYYLYIPIGDNWFGSFVQFMSNGLIIALMAASVAKSFDTSSIPVNHKAVILYFNRAVSSNLKGGFICLGLPTWIGVTLKVINCKKLPITVGRKKGGKVREDFIIECNDVKVILDIQFVAIGDDTDVILKLEEEDIENLLVTEVNAAATRVLNLKANPSAENSLPKFPSIDSMKSSLGQISDLILADAKDGVKRHGYRLESVTVKDVENQDPALIAIKQRKAVQIIQEQIEGIDTTSIEAQALILYNKFNVKGEKERITIQECMDRIERNAGKRVTIETGGALNIAQIPIPTSPDKK